MRFSLFDKKRLTRKKAVVPADAVTEAMTITEDGAPLSVAGREALTRPGKMTVQDEKKIYDA
ncbi:TPA: hypothetical protein PPN70_004880, partial [Serratia rubidaea]|nr:hypothetical protein [Serratia rubidaea]